MFKNEIHALKEKLQEMEAEYNRDREALQRSIDILTRSSRSNQCVLESVERIALTPPPRRAFTSALGNSQSTQEQQDGYGYAMNTVKEVVASLSGEFTVKDVERELETKYPQIYGKIKNQLSNFMWRLKEKEIIQIVTQGSGRNPSLYKKF